MPKGEDRIWNPMAGKGLGARCKIFVNEASFLPRPRLNSSQPGPAQQINSSGTPGSIFGTMLSEWSWLTFQVGNLPPPFPNSTGPHRRLQSFHLSPESAPANPRCLQFRPLPPPFSWCTPRASHLRPTYEIPKAAHRNRAPVPKALVAKQKISGPQCGSVLFRTAGIAQACIWLMRLTSNHSTTEVKLLLLPCARRPPPKRMVWFDP